MNSDYWAVVLGVSSGSGAAMARSLASDPGYSIFGLHRGNYPESAQALEKDLKALGVKSQFLVQEAGTFEGTKLGAEALAGALGPGKVKFFVHSLANASVGQFVSGEEDQFVPRQFEKTFESMAHSFVYWTQEMLRYDLLAPGARLLALTNPLHESMLRQCGAILASKAALEVYVKHLAFELGPRGHRVNLLKFPTVITEAVKKVYSLKSLENIEEEHSRMIPAGRMCTVEEVGDFVSLLADPRSGWLNGATIDFTGGMTQSLLDRILNK